MARLIAWRGRPGGLDPDELRVAALLREAAQPLDPVVSPGPDLSHRARRRLAATQLLRGGSVLGAVLAVGVAGSLLGGAWRGGTPADPVPDAAGLARTSEPTQGRPGVVVDPLENEVRESISAELVRVGDTGYITLWSTLGSADGHRFLTVEDFVLAVDWLWDPESGMVYAADQPDGGTQVPDIKPRFVAPADLTPAEVLDRDLWAPAMVQCLRDGGYPAQVVQALPWVPMADRDGELAPLGRACAAEHQLAWAWDDLSTQEWAEVYDYLDTSWRICGGQVGLDVGTLLPREDFVRAAVQGPLVGPLSSATPQQIAWTREVCRQVPGWVDARH